MPQAIPTPISVRGIDGTEFKVNLKGDEFLNWYEDTSGNVMTKDADGTVRYSEFKKDHFERDESLSKESRRRHLSRRGKDAGVASDITRHGRRRRRDRKYAEDFNDRIQKALNAKAESAPDILGTEDLMSNVEPVTGEVKASKAVQSSNAPAAGSIPFPILIVHTKFENSGAFDQPALTDAEIEDIFFGPSWSVASWYRNATGGAVNVTKASAIKHVTLPGTMPPTFVDTDPNIQFPNTSEWKDLEEPTLNALVNDLNFDFTPYETNVNGDRLITPEKLCVVILLQGYDASGGMPGVWGHAYPGYIWDTPTGAKLMSLQTFGTYMAPGRKLPIGLACHEAGHGRFYLPDLYSTDGSHNGLGVWSIMAGGSWGASGGAPNPYMGGCPTCFDPLSLALIDNAFIGELVNSPGTYQTKFGGDNSDSMSLIATADPKQFFAVQWRGANATVSVDDGKVSMTESYDMALLERWRQDGFVTSYFTGAPLTQFSCNVLYHIDLTAPDNNVFGNMLEHILEGHGGIQNLLEPTGTTNSNYGDPRDPITLASDPNGAIVWAKNTAPVTFDGPINQFSDPPLKLSDGSEPGYELIVFISKEDGSTGYYTLQNMSTPPGSYDGCLVCDKPRVYQNHHW